MPAVCGRVREAVDETEQSSGSQEQAGDVQLELRVRRLAIEQKDSAQKRDGGEDEVDVERPPPGEVVGQGAPEEEADRADCGRDRAEDPERPRPVLRFGEQCYEQRERSLLSGHAGYGSPWTWVGSLIPTV